MLVYENILFLSCTFGTAQKKETADLVTFTGKMLNGKLHFLCSAAIHLGADDMGKVVALSRDKH